MKILYDLFYRIKKFSLFLIFLNTVATILSVVYCLIIRYPILGSDDFLKMITPYNILLSSIDLWVFLLFLSVPMTILNLFFIKNIFKITFSFVIIMTIISLAVAFCINVFFEKGIGIAHFFNAYIPAFVFSEFLILFYLLKKAIK